MGSSKAGQINIQNMDETPAEGAAILATADLIDLDPLDNTLSFFIRSPNIAVSRGWAQRVDDLSPLTGLVKVPALLTLSPPP